MVRLQYEKTTVGWLEIVRPLNILIAFAEGHHIGLLPGLYCIPGGIPWLISVVLCALIASTTGVSTELSVVCGYSASLDRINSIKKKSPCILRWNEEIIGSCRVIWQ